MYVADSGNDRIAHFAADGALVGAWGTTGVGPGEFAYPRGITVAADGDVYVADTANDRVQQFSADGDFVREFGGHGTDFDRFQSPRGVTVTPGGDLLVADAINHRVQRFGPDGSFVAAWGPGRTDGTFRAPAGVAVGSQGDVYVADSFNDRVQRLGADGSFISRWGSSGSARGLFSDPEGTATSTAGDVYVVDRSSVQKFHADGAVPLRRWGRPGSGPSQFDNPHGIAVTPDGDVYVADTGNGRLQWFDASGAYLDSLKLVPGPLDVAVGPTGDVYALNHSAVTVIRDGAIAASWGTERHRAGPVHQPARARGGAQRRRLRRGPGGRRGRPVHRRGRPPRDGPQRAARRRGGGRLDEHTGPDSGCDPRRAALDLHGVDAPVAAAAQPDGARVAVAEREPGHQGQRRGGHGGAAVPDRRLQRRAGVRGRCGSSREHGDRGRWAGQPGERGRRRGGNADRRRIPCSAPIAYISDSIPPTSTIDSGPAPGSTIPGPDATLAFSSLDADVSVFRCKLDAGGYDDCTSPTQLRASPMAPTR